MSKLKNIKQIRKSIRERKKRQAEVAKGSSALLPVQPIAVVAAKVGDDHPVAKFLFIDRRDDDAPVTLDARTSPMWRDWLVKTARAIDDQLDKHPPSPWSIVNWIGACQLVLHACERHPLPMIHHQRTYARKVQQLYFMASRIDGVVLPEWPDVEQMTVKTTLRHLEIVRQAVLAHIKTNSIPKSAKDEVALLPDLQACIPSDDFASVIWFGTEYQFTAPRQRQVIGYLWEQWKKNPALSTHLLRIAEGAGLTDEQANRFKMQHVFRGHPAMGTMIVPTGGGRYRLSDPRYNNGATKSGKIHR